MVGPLPAYPAGRLQQTLGAAKQIKGIPSSPNDLWGLVRVACYEADRQNAEPSQVVTRGGRAARVTEEWLVAEGFPRVENRTRNRATSTGVSPASASQYFVRPGGRCLAWAGFLVGFSIAWLVLAGQPGADVPGWSAVLVVAWTAVPAIVLCAFYLTSRLSVDDGQIELSFFGGLRRSSSAG